MQVDKRKRGMLTTHWVYISEDANGFLYTNFTSEIDIILMKGHHVVYLRSFHSPFDALAHKHLVDHLSMTTVKAMIKREKRQTMIRLKMILFQM